VLDDLIPERTAGRLALCEELLRLAQVRRYVRLVRLVGVAFELVFQREFILYTVQTGGDHGCDRQVRVHVPARQAVLHAQGAAVADDAQATSAVVLAPGDCSRGEGTLRVTLIGVYVRG
jgi:hypothetical protein